MTIIEITGRVIVVGVIIEHISHTIPIIVKRVRGAYKATIRVRGRKGIAGVKCLVILVS